MNIPITESKVWTLFNENSTCALGADSPTFVADAKITLTGKLNATLDFGYAVAGTIVPPEFTAMSLISGLEARLDGILDFDLSATVSWFRHCGAEPFNGTDC